MLCVHLFVFNIILSSKRVLNKLKSVKFLDFC